MSASGIAPLHRWEYGHLLEPSPSGADETSYELAAAWLDHHYEPFRDSSVEDWGCGTTYARKFFSKALYRGVDGSLSKWVDEIRDLRQREPGTCCDGILMRHVLEHIEDWPLVWENALVHARYRICLVLRTPLASSGGAQRLLAIGGNGAPELVLSLFDLIRPLHRRGFTGSWQTFASQTEYGQETIFYCERRLYGPSAAFAGPPSIDVP